MGEPDIWEAHGPDEFGDFNISSKGEKLAKCVVVQNGFRTPEETAAIAKRLIKSVNTHGALVKGLESASIQCGNVIFNCEQRPADNEKHLRSWRALKEYIDAVLASGAA